VWTSGLVDFGGDLYVGTGNDSRNARVYRSNNGTDWSQVGSDGFGDSHNYAIAALTSFNGALYAGAYNSTTGMEVWRSTDGANWSQVNPDGFGDSNNVGATWNNDTAVFNDSLYLGTNNTANGGEIWQMLKSTYLPLLKR